jgi:hypothetical protein
MVAQQQKSGVGCLTIIAVLVLLGLTIEYWYVSVPLIVLSVVGGLTYRSNQQQKQQEIARHRPGPRDPWLNEIAVALADFGFIEYARNTGSQVAGVPIEGDIRLDADGFSVIITLLATAEMARQAEIGLRAKPEVRAAITDGKTIVSAEDLLLYVANGRGGFVDEHRLGEVVQLVGGIPVGPPRTPTVGTGAPVTPPRASAPARPVPPRPPPEVPPARGDVLDQIKRLAELRDAGVLSEAEFGAKKAELLRRL